MRKINVYEFGSKAASDKFVKHCKGLGYLPPRHFRSSLSSVSLEMGNIPVADWGKLLDKAVALGAKRVKQAGIAGHSDEKILWEKGKGKMKEDVGPLRRRAYLPEMSKASDAVSLQIANTIYKQLGGRKFSMMTGAKDLVGLESGLQFKVGRGAKNGINKVVIEYKKGSDLYDMKFYRSTFSMKKGPKTVLKKEYRGVYADQLTRLFKEATGMDTSLF